MPTIQVNPTTSALLQDVADTLGKAKKVVVVTGAGISTNSGIPDFRSEHGLYSLIQAQFEKAAIEDDCTTVDADIEERPSKRRRVSRTQEISMTRSTSLQGTMAANTLVEDQSKRSMLFNPDVADDQVLPTVASQTAQSDGQTLPMETNQYSPRRTRSRASPKRPSLSRNSTESSLQSSESNDATFSAPELSAASSQTGDLTNSDPEPVASSSNSSTPKKLPHAIPFSSSPLSSPPPVLFDPYDNVNQSTEASSQIDSDSDDSDSESQDTASSCDLFSSQTSRKSLRNMKGRDLFDSNIWSDPLKTSVFYRFATTLRQKVKEVEPTRTHHFIAQLRDVGKLARVYTQNIDEIEKKIGLSTDLKNGAGSKRRKSAKQQQLIELEKEARENTESPKAEDDPGGKEIAPSSSQVSEEGERTKPRISITPDKGVECVFLHGSLHALRCFVCGRLCNWDEDGRESCTMSGEQPECPHCAGATAARQEKGKRALGVGKLRPDIVLYGEEHPQSDLISPIVQHDLAAGPDLLLVLGTSLRVHGLKVMVREFAKAVHNKGGKVVFINFTKPSESTWGDVIDYWIEWDCDAWVDDLKERKPALWMSPEDILKEKQRRGELAEKRRESALIRKRENLAAEKKRENASEKKPTSSGVKTLDTRAAVDKKSEKAVETSEQKPGASREKEPEVESQKVLGANGENEPGVSSDEKREAISAEKTEVGIEKPEIGGENIVSVGAGNPANCNEEKPEGSIEEKPADAKEKTSECVGRKKGETMGGKKQQTTQVTSPPFKKRRLDEDPRCGAHVMWEIAKSFQLIRGEPFDFFGYTSAASGPASKPAVIGGKGPKKEAPKETSKKKSPKQEVIQQAVPKPEGPTNDIPQQEALKTVASKKAAPKKTAPRKVAPKPEAPKKRPRKLATKSEAPQKRPRKSTPASLGKEPPQPKSQVKRKPATKVQAQTESDGKLLYKKAAEGLKRSGTPNIVQRLAELRGPGSQPQTPTQANVANEAQPGNGQTIWNSAFSKPQQASELLQFPALKPEMPSLDASPSILAAVKSYPRTRKPSSKKMEEEQPVRRPALPRPRARDTPTMKPSPLGDQENMPYIPPLRMEPKPPTRPQITPMEPEPQLSPRSPLVPEPNQSGKPLALLSPNERVFGLSSLKFLYPLSYGTPLGNLHFAPRTEPVPRTSVDEQLSMAETAAIMEQLRRG